MKIYNSTTNHYYQNPTFLSKNKQIENAVEKILPLNTKRAIHNASITKEQILNLLEANKSVKEIISILEITATAYLSLIKKYGIKTKFQLQKENIAKITADKLTDLINSKKSVKEICQILNIPERTYTRLVDKFGIVTERKKSKIKIKSIKAENLQKLVDTGLTPLEISKELNIDVGTFYKLLKRLKIRYNYEHHYKEITIPTEQLEKLVQSGKTCSEIAELLHIGVTTFHNKAKIKNVKTTFRDSIDTIANISKEQLQSLVDKGKSISEICQILNISRVNYTILIRKHNIQTQQRRSRATISKITKEQIIELRNSGKKVKEICAELNISKNTYSRIMNSASTEAALNT